MGQCASARAKHGVHPKPSIRRRSSIRSATGSIRMSFSKKRPAKRHLSASYQVPEDSPSIEKMDVNAATEEELMTISGIDRALAKNIVNYRDLIGGFRRVEDVALVSGLGAAKFASIRDEICVGSRKRIPSLSSSNSVSNPEQKSVSSMSGIEMTAPTRLDLNQATIFELMSVRGLNQELAANIVYHREKKGPFRCVEDVRKVKGVSRRRAALLKNLLSVDRNAVSCLPRDSSSSTLGCASSQTTPRVAPRRSSPKTKRFARHRRTKSAPTKLSEMINLAVGTSVGILHFEQPSRKNNGFSLNGCQAADNASSPADINRQMYDLLSMKSWPRPIMEEVFLDMRKGNSAFRLATWNFHGFSPEKAENPGVREVICRTILENGLTLIAVQEISCLAVLEKICQELNAPSLRKVIEWDGPRGDWRCWIDSPEAGSEEADWMQRGLRGRFRVRDQSSSSSCDSSHVKCDHVGFLYDSSRGIRLRSAKPFLRSRPPSSAVSSHEESKRRTSSFQLDNINPAFLEYCLAVGNFELEGTEMSLVTAYIRPWGAMQKASPGARQRERVPTIKEVPVVDSSPTLDPRDSPVRSEKDSPDTTASTSPVAQLKEKILGKMDLRRALSIVASDLKSSEVDLALAQARAGLGMIKETLKSQLDLTKVVIMGDTGMSLADPVFEDVQELALTSIVGATTCTTANGRCVPKDDVRCYDNICLSENMKKYFTGHWSIVRQGLDHLAIPRGWGWGGLVSNHCPVWAELYTSVVPETPSSEAGLLTHDTEISDVLLHTKVNGVLPPAKPLCNGLNGINNNPCIISLSEAN